MIGRTNASSGGGISGNRAVLVARIPSGSTVTATKGGVTLTPMMWVSETYPDQDIGLFVFSSAQFDATTPWTITATDGTNTASDTVLITTNKEYEVELQYVFYLYDNGEIATEAGTLETGFNLGVTPTRTYNTTNIYMRGAGSSSAGANGSIVTANAIDITQYSTLNARLSAVSIPSGTTFNMGVTANKTNTFGSYEVRYSDQPSANVDISLDISSITGSKYLGFGGGGSINNTWSFTLVQFWLE